jgi:hypothetical protein
MQWSYIQASDLSATKNRSSSRSIRSRASRPSGPGTFELLLRAPWADRRKVLVEMTQESWRQTGEYYGALADEGARMLEQYTDAQLTAMCDHLRAATQLIDRHRARIRGTSSSGSIGE